METDIEFVNATQVVEIVLETQAILEIHKEQVEISLEKSWANMVELANDEDPGLDYIPEKEYFIWLLQKKATEIPNLTQKLD